MSKPPTELTLDETTRLFDSAKPFLDQINVTYSTTPEERLKLFMGARFIDIRCRADGREYYFEGEKIRSHIQDLQNLSSQTPQPFTGEMWSFLLVNALRLLTEEQRAGLCFDLYCSCMIKENIDNKIEALKADKQ